jgi:hypothetical protein
MHAKYLALLAARVLPGWLSTLVLAVLFLAVWRSPEWFGWESMGQLQAVVFVEVIAVHGFLFMVTGRDHPNEWSTAIYVALLVAIVLFSTIGPIAAIVITLLLVTRVVATLSDDATTAAVTKSLVGSIGLMILSWLIVGFVPLPALGWTEVKTPSRLWWSVPDFSGGRRVSFGLPAWAFLYFFLTTLIEVWNGLLHLARRTALTTRSKAA